MVGILGLSLVFKSTEVVKYWFESQVQSRYTVWIENGAFVIMAGVKVAMILRQAPLIAFVWITFAEAVLVACGLLAIYSKRGGYLSAWKPRIARAKKLLRNSWPFMMAGLAVMTYMRIDQIMLGGMLGPEAVGVYTAAVGISEVWYFIPMLVVSSISPSIIKAKNQSLQLYHQRLQWLYRLLVMLCLLIAIPMTVLSSALITLLYGSGYEQAGPVLAIHIWAGIPVALGVASSQALLVENLQLYSFYRTLIGCILNILLNLLLIPSLGIVGAAVATVISYLAATFSLIIFPNCRSITLLIFRSIFLLPARGDR